MIFILQNVIATMSRDTSPLKVAMSDKPSIQTGMMIQNIRGFKRFARNGRTRNCKIPLTALITA
jgi:hypothetical protein